MSYTATTWRWPDSTFGPQRNVPFSDDQQYPDCGPSRIYTLENILYGLENIVTPLLTTIADQTSGAQTLKDTSSKLVLTSSYASPTAQACVKATIYLLSTATESASIKINSGGEIILEAGYSMQVNCDDLTKIEAKQATGGDTLYIVYSEKV